MVPSEHESGTGRYVVFKEEMADGEIGPVIAMSFTHELTTGWIEPGEGHGVNVNTPAHDRRRKREKVECIVRLEVGEHRSARRRIEQEVPAGKRLSAQALEKYLHIGGTIAIEIKLDYQISA